ncbi:hypothetical protein GCM10009717_04090 [Agromyces allii]|uniref:Uncharacterized protein n=1 Tax=Agromyces allii TaxID=393607 RepID=A0ABN2Q265_9MICO
MHVRPARRSWHCFAEGSASETLATRIEWFAGGADVRSDECGQTEDGGENLFEKVLVS